MITDNNNKYLADHYLSMPDLSTSPGAKHFLVELRRTLSVSDKLLPFTPQSADPLCYPALANALTLTKNITRQQTYSPEEVQLNGVNKEHADYSVINMPSDINPLAPKAEGNNNYLHANGAVVRDEICIDIPESVISKYAQNLNYSPPTSYVRRLDFLQRHGRNVGLVLSRNLVSVAIPTTLREYVAKNVLPVLLKNAPVSASVTLGAIAIAMPIALQLAGIARDLHAGTQTAASLSARLANIALITGAGSALVATAGITLAANALIAAVFIYVPLRDIAQYFLQLSDNSKPGLSLEACGKSAIAYSGNQMLVSEGMTLLSRALEPLLGAAIANMLGKAIINTIGETADEMTYRGLTAQAQHNSAVSFDLRLRPLPEINYQTATDRLLTTVAARASQFSSVYSGVNAVPFADVFKSMMIGLMLGAGYIPFFYCHAQAAAPQPGAQRDSEGGR
ncbi:hypothetical protein N5923_19205 [Erwiniaceae bacterium BAC15a-03b]|uniref:Uncharacterized protein n=1 Tax=Winslowiella arboricola TaxID=2978220 RepID=A0A9J6PQA5_9GAMM|nr:hypothetical protein [Winslowiella arboricola]MCU5775532.1 hypothetical protein [Winslowiella arboricola]MCU5779618.1 hypothetical protein [Winslowiella arboricola]